jgi:hypothetical protein
VSSSSARRPAILLAGMLLLPVTARAEPGPDTPPVTVQASTPELIDLARAQGRLGRAAAARLLAYALADPGRVPPAYRGDRPWRGTWWLLRLRDEVAGLPPGRDRREIRTILGPQGGADAQGAATCGTSGTPLPDTLNTAHFHIEHNAALIGGGLTIQDYADSLERAWRVEVERFGWARPPSHPQRPAPGKRYHVRIDALAANHYGFVANFGSYAGRVGNNPATSWNEGDADASCMVLNQNLSGFPSSPRDSLDATTAHEFNHSIQFGYGALAGPNVPDLNVVEGGATWMEDEVFDGSNDNRHYLWPDVADDMGDYDASPYGYWVVWRAMLERYGSGQRGGSESVFQRFWVQISKNASSMLVAMDRALGAKGTTLANEFHRAAVALKFNRPCGSGYRRAVCLEEGSGYVGAAGATPVHRSIPSAPGRATGKIADNYSVQWVRVPSSGPAFRVVLRNRSGGGRLRATMACDTGEEIRRTRLSRVAGPGQSARVPRFRPGPCAQAVVVITNQKRTAANPATSASRDYSLAIRPV